MKPDLGRTLVVMALEIEGQGVFEREQVPVLYTGIGKVNAAIALTRRLAEYRFQDLPPPLVVNFGSAGSQRFPSNTLVACTKFVQRDMDVSGLGFPIGVTPFEKVPAQLEFPAVFRDLVCGICGTGDSFDMSARVLTCDLVDMEAYALAKVCHSEQAAFACVKFITDGADSNAAANWEENVHRAAERFLELFKSLPDKSAQTKQRQQGNQQR